MTPAEFSYSYSVDGHPTPSQNPPDRLNVWRSQTRGGVSIPMTEVVLPSGVNLCEPGRLLEAPPSHVDSSRISISNHVILSLT